MNFNLEINWKKMRWLLAIVIPAVLGLIGFYLKELYSENKIRNEIITDLYRIEKLYENSPEDALQKCAALWNDKIVKCSEKNIEGIYHYINGNCHLKLGIDKGDLKELNNARLNYEMVQKDSIKYPLAKIKLGETYLQLSYRTDKENNLKSALTAFLDAEQLLKDVNNPDYERMIEYLGFVYLKLFEVNQDFSNLSKAYAYEYNALEIEKGKKDSKRLPIIKKELGIFHLQLASDEFRKSNLKKAEIYLQAAHENIKRAENPRDNAAIMNALGLLYLRLFKISKDKASMEKSIASFKGAINIFEGMKVKDVNMIALYKNNLIWAYIIYGQQENRLLTDAINESENIIHQLREQSAYKRQYGRALKYKGIALYYLCLINPERHSSEESRRCLSEAKEYLDSSDFDEEEEQIIKEVSGNR